MFRSHQFIATCFAFVAWAFMPGKATAAASATEIVDLQPFTHIAYIPVGVDLSSMKLEEIKLVKVATKLRSLTDPQYCGERLAAEPGGSMYCAQTANEFAVPAYKITYRFTAPPLASDEYGNTSFTFSVYFRPDEVNPSLRQALSSRKIRRTDAAEYFQLVVSRDSVERLVINETNSIRCDGTYVDGNWLRTNPECQDSIIYKSIASPSPCITVRVDAALARLQANVKTTALPWK